MKQDLRDLNFIGTIVFGITLIVTAIVVEFTIFEKLVLFGLFLLIKKH